MCAVRTVAGVVLLRDDNAALLQLRDNKPGLNAAGLWVFPGGHCEPGESLEDGARREFREETGYVCAALRWVTRILHPSDDGRLTYRLGMFACRYDGLQPSIVLKGKPSSSSGARKLHLALCRNMCRACGTWRSRSWPIELDAVSDATLEWA